MIEDLLKAKKISEKEFKLYKLFSSELGQECLRDMKDELFMEEPFEEQMTGVRFAFYDGRRAYVRSILSVINKVQSIIKENNYVGAEQPGY